MIEVHYFASIREALDCDKESLALPEGVQTIADLITYLIKDRDERWSKTLDEGSVLAAINQTVAKLSSSINDGDEVAFFPPVTGG